MSDDGFGWSHGISENDLRKMGEIVLQWSAADVCDMDIRGFAVDQLLEQGGAGASRAPDAGERGFGIDLEAEDVVFRAEWVFGALEPHHNGRVDHDRLDRVGLCGGWGWVARGWVTHRGGSCTAVPCPSG